MPLRRIVFCLVDKIKAKTCTKGRTNILCGDYSDGSFGLYVLKVEFGKKYIMDFQSTLYKDTGIMLDLSSTITNKQLKFSSHKRKVQANRNNACLGNKINAHIITRIGL